MGDPVGGDSSTVSEPDKILAAAVAVAIIKARRADKHPNPQTPEDKLALTIRHSIETLAELGLPREDLPDPASVEREINRRGGWGAQAQTTPLTYVMQCLQCDNGEIKTFPSVTGRKKFMHTHREATGHTVISRWEQPSIM